MKKKLRNLFKEIFDFNELKLHADIKIVLYRLSCLMSTIKRKKMDKLVKSFKEIDKMRIAGRLAAEVLEMITPHVVPGISTGELDKLCYEHIVNIQNAIPANVGYKGYKKTICSSINNVICHGIPDNEKILKNGDILNIDVTVIKDGWHGDTSKMFLVGKCAPHNERLVKITQECLYKGIEVVKPGAYLGDVGNVIQQHAEKNYYSVVEDYCGHGIGTTYHEEPQVLHYGKSGTGIKLEEGMCFTIEPMINQGTKFCKVLKDGWTVETKDGRNSAQWEHTIAVTKNGSEILTKRNDEF